AHQRPCGWHCSGDHSTRLAEKVLVVLAAFATKRHHQGRLPSSTCASTPLRIVRGRRGHVSEVDYIQVTDVHAQFHRRGAEQRSEIASTNACLAILAQLHRN